MLGWVQTRGREPWRGWFLTATASRPFWLPNAKLFVKAGSGHRMIDGQTTQKEQGSGYGGYSAIVLLCHRAVVLQSQRLTSEISQEQWPLSDPV